jgi:hypothetical protein
MKYIGIAKEKNDPWYYIIIMFGNRMIKITPYTERTKRPAYYFYNKDAFKYAIEIGLFELRWFVGLTLDK